MEELLELCDPNVVNREGTPLLTYAIKTRRKRSIKLLLKKCSD
jgi:ankyrin repeat protein